MAKKQLFKIEKLPDGSHKIAGSYDKAARWYPYDDFVVPGSFDVRSPSRAWPYSYLKHFYSTKYARLLFVNDPRKYARLHGINLQSELGKMLLAQVAVNKIRGTR